MNHANTLSRLIKRCLISGIFILFWTETCCPMDKQGIDREVMLSEDTKKTIITLALPKPFELSDFELSLDLVLKLYGIKTTHYEHDDELVLDNKENIHRLWADEERIKGSSFDQSPLASAVHARREFYQKQIVFNENYNPKNYLVRFIEGDETNFSIITEIQKALALQEEKITSLIAMHNRAMKKKRKTISLTEDDIPLFYRMLSSVYEKISNTISPRKQKLSYSVCFTTGMSIGIRGCNYSELDKVIITVGLAGIISNTNQELEHIFAHEFVHALMLHTHFLHETHFPGITLPIIHSLARCCEADADRLSLLINGPSVLISSILKTAYYKTINLFQLKQIYKETYEEAGLATPSITTQDKQDFYHPSDHERICYGLSLLQQQY